MRAYKVQSYQAFLKEGYLIYISRSEYTLSKSQLMSFQYLSSIAILWFEYLWIVQGGIVFSNVVTTVSPTYAQEVLQPEVSTQSLLLSWSNWRAK